MSGKTVDGLMALVSDYGNYRQEELPIASDREFDAIRTYAEALAAPQEQPAQWRDGFYWGPAFRRARARLEEAITANPEVTVSATDLAMLVNATANYPEAAPAALPAVQPLTDAVRVPLDELEADAGYIIGRAIADASCRDLMVEAIRKRTRAIREALASPAKEQPAEGGHG